MIKDNKAASHTTFKKGAGLEIQTFQNSGLCFGQATFKYLSESPEELVSS